VGVFGMMRANLVFVVIFGVSETRKFVLKIIIGCVRSRIPSSNTRLAGQILKKSKINYFTRQKI
jgi:hypothetical protein